MSELFISYAQHGEDVVLWRALKDRTGVFYVDVGAYHPTWDSVTRALYERGWRGVNVEPQPERIAAFEEERPEDVNLALAIGGEDGTAVLTVPENQGWASLLPSASTGAALSAHTTEVPLRRLCTLFAEQGITHVDVLKVDVEGAESAVIRGLLDGDVRPVVCVIEGVAPGVGRVAGDEAVASLVAAGYTHCLFDGLNHYLTTDTTLVEALSTPANPLDGYVTDLVHRLMAEREHQIGVIAGLVSENAGLRGLNGHVGETPVPHPAAPGRAGTASSTAIPSPTSPSADGRPDGETADGAAASADDTAVGELPLPEAGAVTGAEAGLAVPTSALDTLAAQVPARPAPLTDPTTRARRRRATLARLLGVRTAEPTVHPYRPERLSAGLESLPHSEAVAVLYRLILGREAEADGLSTWVSRMEAEGLPLLAVAFIFAESDEAALAHPTHRARVSQELEAWAGGAVLAELGATTGLTRSYSVDAAAHRLFVEALYEVALHREPNPQELAIQLQLLGDGVGRERMIRGFAGLPEARAQALGRPRGGPRGRLADWRARRSYLAGFRAQVLVAEAHRVATLNMRVALGGQRELAHSAGDRS